MAQDAESGKSAAVILERHLSGSITITAEEIARGRSNPDSWIEECIARDVRYAIASAEYFLRETK